MGETKLPNRKSLRLKSYDYSQKGIYFVTICVKDKEHLLCNAKSVVEKRVGTGLCARPNKKFVLTPIGTEVEKAIQHINIKYSDSVKVENSCIMPNHIHLLISISACDFADGHRDPSLRDIIRNFKSYTTMQYRKAKDTATLLWQSGYYDHIIRNDEDYAEKYDYISNNPLKWFDDEYYIFDNK